MKRYVIMAAIALLAASCSNESEELETETETLVPVTVQVNDFSVSMEDPNTRATDVASYDGIKALTLAFYDTNGTEVYKTTQQKSDNTTYTTFGQFKLNLHKGSYTMVALGYGLQDGDVFTLTSPTQAAFTGDHPRETFTYTQSVEITSNTAVTLTATLDRIVSKLLVQSTDNRVAGAQTVKVTFAAGGKSFNPTTGLATVNTGFVNIVPISSEVGTTSRSANYVFLNTNEQNMDITIDVLDAQGTSLTHRVIPNVPFMRNRCTTLTGPLYSAGVTSTFQVNTAWQPMEEVSF